MNWHELYPKSQKPELSQISDYINSSLWEELCSYLETTYGVLPKVEHSICSAAPGWNVKYKKSSRALCTLYPAKGYFTAMVCIGNHEALKAQILLELCTDYLRELYSSAPPQKGTRWLMIEVTSPQILEDVKDLIALRMEK